MRIKKLLSKGTSNAKTVKNKRPTYILYLAPEKTNSYGINICPNATKGCSDACLFTAGRASIFPTIIKSRIRKTDFYISDRQAFCNQLLKELINIDKRGIKTAIRLNGTSDLDFVGIIKNRCNFDILTLKNLVFYDYTAIPGKVLKYRDVKNYVISFSRKENNEQQCIELLKQGFNVSVVFRTGNFPKTWQGFKVVNGDASDDQMINRKGIVLALKAKGKAKKDKTGFVVD